MLFLRRIVKGGADRSYGIHVAKLAGLPKAVLDRSNTILSHLEDGKVVSEAVPKKKENKVLQALYSGVVIYLHNLFWISY